MSEQILVYDLEEHKVVFGYQPMGLTRFISWERLAETFAEVEEIQPREKVCSFSVSDRGLYFIVGRKE